MIDPVHPDYVTTDIKMMDGLFVKVNTFLAADMAGEQHAHDYDHLSFIANGSVALYEAGRYVGTHKAPAGVVVKAHTKHVFVTLEPNTTVLCIHRTDAYGTIPLSDRED